MYNTIFHHITDLVVIELKEKNIFWRVHSEDRYTFVFIAIIDKVKVKHSEQQENRNDHTVLWFSISQVLPEGTWRSMLLQ